MAIRRQIKTNNDSISLSMLLKELIDNPTLVTRTEFVDLYGKGHGRQFGERDFAAYAEDGQSHISASRVCQDLFNLLNLARNIEEHADRRIAHWDKREPLSELTPKIIFDALDELGNLTRKYYLLLFAADLELSPVPQEPVFHVFQEPWL